MDRLYPFRQLMFRAFLLIAFAVTLSLSTGCDRCRKLCTKAKKCLAKKGEKMSVGQFSDCEWHCRQGVERREGKGYDEYGKLVEKTCRGK